MNKPQKSAARCTLALAVFATLTASLSSPAQAHDHGHRVVPPAVPGSLRVEDGNKAFLVGHATGTQNYICLPAGAGFAWTLFTPQATLFNGGDRQIITHFFSPNPDENGTVRATWEDSRDTSTVWALASAPPSFDPAFVAPGAVAWLKLQVVGQEDGPDGGDRLSATTFIQRVNTAGGLAPPTGCSQLSNVGAKSFQPYTADYYFFASEERNDDR